MMAGLLVHDRTLRCQVRSMLLVVLPMVAAMALGLLVGPYRVPSLAFLIVVMALAVYVRRFGPRGFGAGMGAFIGAFLGFLLHTELGLGDTGWIAADLGLGVLAAQVVRFAFASPAERTLARMRRSQVARVPPAARTERECARRGGRAPYPEGEERMRRQLVRLNETTLMIDAELAEVRPRTAVVEAQRLFDAELAVSNSARFRLGAGHERRAALRAPRRGRCVVHPADGHPPSVSRAVAELRTAGAGRSRASVLASRLARLGGALCAGPRPGPPPRFATRRSPRPRAATSPRRSSLVNGWLPGSMPVAPRPRSRGGPACSTARRCRRTCVPHPGRRRRARSPSSRGTPCRARGCTGRCWRASSPSSRPPTPPSRCRRALFRVGRHRDRHRGGRPARTPHRWQQLALAGDRAGGDCSSGST